MDVAKELPKELYFDVDLHRQFRSVSKLNQELDSLTSRVPGVEIVHVNQAEEQGAYRSDYEFKQEIFANLLVRDQCDIVSVITAGKNTPAGDQQITVIHDPGPQVVIASNPNPADRPHTTLPGEDGVHVDLRVEAILDPTGLDISQGVVHAVLSATRERGGHIPFKMHVGWHGALLRECHKSNHNEDTFAIAVENFRSFVYLVSNAKMVARLDMGLSDRSVNFHKVITAKQKQFALGSFDREDIAQDMVQTLPTDDQAAFIKRFLRGFKSEGEADKLSTSPLYDVEGRKRFHQILGTLVDDTMRALKSLKTLLAQLSRHRWVFDDSDEGVKGKVSLRDVETRVKRAADEVYLLQRFLELFGNSHAGRGRNVLGTHLEWLSKVAEAHSRHAPTSLTPEEDFEMKFPQQASSTVLTTRAAQQASALGHDLPGSANEGTGDASMETVAGGDGNMADVKGYQSVVDAEQDQSMLDAEEDQDESDEFDFLAERVVDTQSSKKGGWPAAACKWLQLICLHEVGLLRATRFNFENKDTRERAESDHILSSTIAVVEIQRSRWDDDRASFTDQLREFAEKNEQSYLEITDLTSKLTQKIGRVMNARWAKQDERENRQKQYRPPLSDDELQQLRNDRAAQVESAKSEHMNSTRFSGTYHCEAIIMGAMVILNQPGVSEQLTDEWLKCNGIFSIKSELLRMLKDPLPLLCVSKRCCPGCWSVFKKISKDNVFPGLSARMMKVAMPGYHTKWFSHDLPPFLPKDYLEYAVKEAKKQALEKLVRLQGEIDREKANEEVAREIDREKATEEAAKKSSSEGATSNPPTSNPPSSANPTPVKKPKIDPDIKRSDREA